MPRLLLALCILSLSFPVAAEPPVTTEKPWVREAPPGTSVSAAYLILHNRGETAVSLTAVSADEFARGELHETVHEDGQARMRRIDELTIPAGERVALEPGGKHIMLHDPRRELREGDWVTLTLRFDNEQLLQIAAPVRQRTGRSGENEQDSKHQGEQP